MKYQPYPAYKPSGIEWLGEIPEHWDLKRIRHSVTSIKNGTTTTQVDYDTDYMVTRIETISNGEIDYEKVGHVEHDSTLDQYRLEKGDILLSHINSLEMVGNCAIYKGEKQLYGGMNLLRLRPKSGVMPFYLLWWLKTDKFLHAIRMLAKHAINQVSVPILSLKDIPFLCPPIDEQRAIAAFLDRETTRIDTLIEKKQRQIELLQEKRSALISHAVTKGLNPNVKMKDSGIVWLGEIPEHWAVVRIKYVSSINDETLSETTYPDHEILYVDIGSVDAASGVQKKELLQFEDAPSRARRKVRHGDVIVSTVRTYLRAIAPIIEPEDNLIVSTGFAVIRPRQGLDSGFAAYMLRAPYFVDAVVARSVGVSYPAINASDIGNLFVAIPPSPDQRAIAAFLDRETTRIDTLIKKITKSIDLLREYRMALISAAVTGKIDVCQENMNS